MRTPILKFLLISATLFAFSTTLLAKKDDCKTPLKKSVSQKPIDFSDSITYWYSSIELGPINERRFEKNAESGRLMLTHIRTPDRTIDLRSFNIEMMPGCNLTANAYYSIEAIDQKTKLHTMKLYPIEEGQRINDLADSQLKLVWERYKLETVVTDPEIESFKKTEKELAPQRKVTFVITDRSGRPQTVMRMYDGSPFPASFLGDVPHLLHSPESDGRPPLERRYPELNFRKYSDWIFEAGRLAKDDGVSGALQIQFHNLAYYLFYKLGYAQEAPDEYVNKGRVYIEITGKHLDKYLKTKKQGGMGFKLFAMAVDEKPMQKMNAGTKFQDIDRDQIKDSSKFILYMSVFDFIKQFRLPIH